MNRRIGVRITWLPYALIGTGCVLVGVTALESLVRTLGRLPVTIPFVAGVVTSLPFALLIVGGGIRLRRGEISEERYSRIGGWVLVGSVFFLGFFSIIAVFMFDDPWDRIGVFRWALSVGAGGGFLVGFVNARSIERVVAAERASIRAEEARERQELLEYLNSLLRHEVLNTANIIEGHAEIIEGTLDDDTDGEEYAGIIRRNAEKLTRVTEDVRVLLERTDENEDSQRVDLVGILRKEIERLENRHRSVETEVELPEEAIVEGDELLHRVFSHLLENAVEHNEGSRPRVSIEVTTSGETITIRIADNGPGIPEEEREDLFEPTVNMGPNHGLGLPMVESLINRYGGRIELTETGSDGSVFTVELPRRDQTEPTATADPTASS